jgi:hypothetical protein
MNAQRFLGIILSVLRLEVSDGFLIPKGRGYDFLFPPFSFTVYSNLFVEICKRLREFVDIEILRQ